MQVTEISSEGLKREYKIVVEADDIGRKVDEKLAELSRQIRLPGFRPGKVPVTLVRKRYGASVRGEVLEEALNDSTRKAIEDRSLRPALQPKIEIDQFEEGKDLEYTVRLEILPDIETIDFAELELERLRAEPTDAGIDEVIADMAEGQKSFAAVTDGRASREGDALLIDFIGRIDGTEFEGGSATDFQIELGSETFIPGFEAQLVGAKAGEHRDVEVTFPEDYAGRDLAGKQAVFAVEVKEVREAQPVAVDDELARRMGLENLDALKEAVRRQISQDYAAVSRARLKRALLDALAERHEFAVPESMVDMEFEGIWKEIERHREKGDLDEADAAKSEDELREEYRKIAERRVRLGLLLSEVGRRNNIEVHQDEMTRAMFERARAFPGRERQFIDFVEKSPEAQEEIRAPIFEDKVVDFIIEMARVSERTVTPEELLRDPDEDRDSGADAAAPEEKGRRKRKAKPSKTEE